MINSLRRFNETTLLPLSHTYAISLGALTLLVLVGSLITAGISELGLLSTSGGNSAPRIDENVVETQLKPTTYADESTKTPKQNTSMSIYSPVDLASGELDSIIFPDKDIKYFLFFRKFTTDVIPRCGGGFDLDFVKNMTAIARVFRERGNQIDSDRFVDAFCSSWQAELKRLEATKALKKREEYEKISVRDTATRAAGYSLFVLLFFTLASALFAIERNTRSMFKDKVEKISGTLGILVLIGGLLTAGWDCRANAQAFESEQQKLERESKEIEQERVAEVAREVDQLKKHIGHTYTFNPMGAAREISGSRDKSIWFYKSIFSTFESKPDDRVRPSTPTEFTVKDLTHITCWTDRLAKEYLPKDSEECYFYIVDMGGATYYMEAGILSKFGKFGYLGEGVDALKTISDAEDGVILSAMPQELELQRKEKIRSSLEKKFAPELIEAIMVGDVHPGWSEDAVEASLGKPIEVLFAPPNSKLWLYKERYVVFDGDLVQFVKETEKSTK